MHARFLLLLPLLLLPRISSAKIVEIVPDEARNEQLYHEGMNRFFGELSRMGGETILATGSGKVIALSDLLRRLPSIQFRSRRGMLTVGSAPDLCYSEIQAFWLTAQDDPRSGRPLVVHAQVSPAEDFSSQDWSLFFHETISALGLVDDEYQISGPLMALADAARNSHKNFSTLLAEPPYSSFAPALQRVALRDHAPRYTLDRTDRCYVFPKEGGRGKQVFGNTTGIGGGGYWPSLEFKKDLLLAEASWWEKNNSRGLPAERHRAFAEIVQALGLEPLFSENGAKIITPVQIEYGKSKRTGKWTAYLFLEDLYRMKEEHPRQQLMIQDHTGEFRSFSNAEWGGALDFIFWKIYSERLR